MYLWFINLFINKIRLLGTNTIYLKVSNHIYTLRCLLIKKETKSRACQRCESSENFLETDKFRHTKHKKKNIVRRQHFSLNCFIFKFRLQTRRENFKMNHLINDIHMLPQICYVYKLFEFVQFVVEQFLCKYLPPFVKMSTCCQSILCPAPKVCRTKKAHTKLRAKSKNSLKPIPWIPNSKHTNPSNMYENVPRRIGHAEWIPLNYL